jgi:hypothetical protein
MCERLLARPAQPPAGNAIVPEVRDVEHIHRDLDPTASPAPGVADGHHDGVTGEEGLFCLNTELHPSVPPVIHHAPEAFVAAVDPRVGQADGDRRHDVLVDELEQGSLIADVVGRDGAAGNLEVVALHALKYHLVR